MTVRRELRIEEFGRKRSALSAQRSGNSIFNPRSLVRILQVNKRMLVGIQVLNAAAKEGRDMGHRLTRCKYILSQSSSNPLLPPHDNLAYPLPPLCSSIIPPSLLLNTETYFPPFP